MFSQKPQIFSGKLPFGEISNEYQVVLMVMSGKKLSRPPAETCSQFGLNDNIWKLLEACWQTDPTERPTARRVVEIIKTTVTLVERSISLEKRDELFTREIRSNLDSHPLSSSLDDADSSALLARASTNFEVNLPYINSMINSVAHVPYFRCPRSYPQ